MFISVFFLEQNKGLFFFLALNLDDLLSVIHTAGFANPVWEAGCAAAWADCNLNALVAVCGMALANYTLADFTLLNGHFSLTPDLLFDLDFWFFILMM